MRLTMKERQMVVRAIEFIEAGEWPWEIGGPYDPETPQERQDRAALRRAKEKLER